MTGKRTDNTRGYVIDASVAVKWFSKEAGSREARTILEKCESGSVELHAPDLLLYEVGNALVRGKGLDAVFVKDALVLLLQSKIKFSPLDDMLIGRAAEISEKHRLTFYDAAYVALADTESATLLSANPKDHKKVEGVRVKILGAK